MSRTCQLDHLVVTARSLDVGAAWVTAALGVAPQTGGKHHRMGTHNVLLRLSGTAYLEVIAPDPGAPPPARPRWFELDGIAQSSPRLASWVARTDDISSTVGACNAGFGTIERMSRESLDWLITIPPDGGLVAGGAIPMLIEWLLDEHPAAQLEDKGCSLSTLQIFHPDISGVRRTLECLGMGATAVMHELPADARPYLVADIETPLGPRSIGAPPE